VLPGGIIQSVPLKQGAFDAEPLQHWRQTTALLEVQRDGDGFRVRGTNLAAELPWVSGSRYGRPNLALARMTGTEDPELPLDIIEIMREWSRTHDEIIDWINGLRPLFGDELRLVIWDDTGFDFPWELIWLQEVPQDGLPGGWLGGLVSVSRWTRIYKDERNPYSDDPAHCSGNVVAYIDEAMIGDYTALRNYGCQPENEISDIAAFLQRMADTKAQFALVYMATHGQYGTKWTALKLASKRITELRDKFRALRTWPGLVFLNACHSGQLIDDPAFGDHLLRGFAELFLSEGAVGVIATLGKVGDQYGREVAERVVDMLAGIGNTPVSVAMRDLRAQAAEEKPESSDDPRELLPFLYTFMYIYYGNPSTTIRLSRRPDGG
jgi:hypothetical protein